MEKSKLKIIIPVFLFCIFLVSAVGISFFITHITGVIHSGLAFSNTGNQNIGTCWTNSFCNSNNISVQVNSNQSFTCLVTVPNTVDSVFLVGLNTINSSINSTGFYFNINQPSGNYSFYISYFINKYANDSSAIFSDLECY